MNTLGLPVLDAQLCVYAFAQVTAKIPIGVDGSFTIDQLPEIPPTEGGWAIGAQGCDPIHVPYDSPGFWLPRGDLPATITLVVLRKNAVYGTVIDEFGHPIPNACIVMTSDDPLAPPIPPFMNRSDGSYGPFEALPAVTYDVEIRDGSCLGPTLDPVPPSGNRVILGYSPMCVDLPVKRPS